VPKHVTADEVIALCRSLPSEERQRVLRALTNPVAPTPPAPRDFDPLEGIKCLVREMEKDAGPEGETESEPWDPGRAALDPSSWKTLGEVAIHLEKSKSQVSRYVTAGRLRGNGRKHKHFRILWQSVGTFHWVELRAILVRMRNLSEMESHWENIEKALPVFDQLILDSKQMEDEIMNALQCRREGSPSRPPAPGQTTLY
jgi:hypothetical protein